MIRPLSNTPTSTFRNNHLFHRDGYEKQMADKGYIKLSTATTFYRMQLGLFKT